MTDPHDTDPYGDASGILRTEPPDTLYHYTDQRGLLGILESRCLHATNIRYLNDAREFHHALRLAMEWVEAKLKGASGEDVRLLQDILITSGELFGPVVAYVASLTRHGNQLSQWRAYCGPSGGFAVGFRTASLLRLVDAGQIHLMRCVYDPGQQRVEIGWWLDDFIGELRKRAAEQRAAGLEPDYIAYRELFYFAVHELAPAFKHRAFREEDEWRIVHAVEAPLVAPVQFRTGASGPTPYIPIPVAGAQWDNEIAVIKIGPMRHRKLSADAVEMMVDSYGLKGCKVRESRVPFRTR